MLEQRTSDAPFSETLELRTTVALPARTSMRGIAGPHGMSTLTTNEPAIVVGDHRPEVAASKAVRATNDENRIVRWCGATIH